jgi:hypothetical protein
LRRLFLLTVVFFYCKFRERINNDFWSLKLKKTKRKGGTMNNQSKRCVGTFLGGVVGILVAFGIHSAFIFIGCLTGMVVGYFQLRLVGYAMIGLWAIWAVVVVVTDIIMRWGRIVCPMISKKVAGAIEWFCGIPGHLMGVIKSFFDFENRSEIKKWLRQGEEWEASSEMKLSEVLIFLMVLLVNGFWIWPLLIRGSITVVMLVFQLSWPPLGLIVSVLASWLAGLALLIHVAHEFYVIGDEPVRLRNIRSRKEGFFRFFWQDFSTIVGGEIAIVLVLSWVAGITLIAVAIWATFVALPIIVVCAVVFGLIFLLTQKGCWWPLVCTIGTTFVVWRVAQDLIVSEVTLGLVALSSGCLCLLITEGIHCLAIAHKERLFRWRGTFTDFIFQSFLDSSWKHVVCNTLIRTGRVVEMMSDATEHFTSFLGIKKRVRAD